MRPDGGMVTGDRVDGDLRVDCKAGIVGSGAGGATVAAELAAAGIGGVMVEEGGYHPTESFRPVYGQGLRTLYRDGGVGLALGSPPVLFSEGRCVGGSTVVNGGMSFRTPEAVLDRWAREESVSAIGPAEMERPFLAVERRLPVAHHGTGTIRAEFRLL